MMMTNVRENLVVGGAFGCLIGGLFFSFGGISNFLCERLFWSYVVYVAVIYFEIAPSFVRDLMKKYSSTAYYLSWLAWVPLVVGGAMVVFLGSLLFVDYDIGELNRLLDAAKIALAVMMMGTLMLANIIKTNKARLFLGG